MVAVAKQAWARRRSRHAADVNGLSDELVGMRLESLDIVTAAWGMHGVESQAEKGGLVFVARSCGQ